MHGSKLSYRVWWLAIYQLTTLKGVSSRYIGTHLPEDGMASWTPHPSRMGGWSGRWAPTSSVRPK